MKINKYLYSTNIYISLINETRLCFKWHLMHRRISLPVSLINWYRILVTITLRLSGINLFVSTNWNDRTVSLRRDNSSGRILKPMTNFPKPIVRSGGPPYSPGACRTASGLFISQHGLFYHGSTSFVVRSSHGARRDDRYKSTGGRFPSVLIPLTPRH